LSTLSLRWKFIIGTTCIVLAVVGSFSFVTLKLQERQIEADQKERVVLITEIIKNGLITFMLEGRGREFQKFLEALISKDIEEARIFTPDGIITSSTVPYEIGKKIHKIDLEQFSSQKTPEVFTHKRKNGQLYYSMVVPIYNESACIKCHKDSGNILGVLDIEVSTRKTRDQLNNSRRILFIFAFFTLLTISVALSLLTRYLINRPIRGIVDIMQQAKNGNLLARFHTNRSDEVGILSQNLNEMLSQLDQAQKQLERYHREELERIEKMATIGELASAIAHEIKNPLAGISGAIQVLAEDFDANDPRREVIEDVIKEIERLDKSIRELLHYAKPPDPIRLSTDVYSLMERLMSVISLQAKKQHIIIHLEIVPETLSTYLDPELFQQVFLNIALNAIQSMPSGGELRISVRKESNMVVFSFSDSGTGIPDNIMDNIFKPFYTTKQGGTGLGLSISKKIVEQHGGTITIESAQGKGSTFSVSVPFYGEDDERI